MIYESFICRTLIVLVSKQNNYNFQNIRSQDSKKVHLQSKYKNKKGRQGQRWLMASWGFLQYELWLSGTRRHNVSLGAFWPLYILYKLPCVGSSIPVSLGCSVSLQFSVLSSISCSNARTKKNNGSPLNLRMLRGINDDGLYCFTKSSVIVFWCQLLHHILLAWQQHYVWHLQIHHGWQLHHVCPS